MNRRAAPVTPKISSVAALIGAAQRRTQPSDRAKLEARRPIPATHALCRGLSFEKNDQVWAIFDRDNHSHFEEAIDLCERNGVGAAWSNPCFELWLILHEADYGKPGTHQHVQQALAALRPEYDRSGAKIPDCDDMVGQVEDAERRGAMLLREREKDGSAPFGNPSTTVGQLTRAIREADRRARPPG